MKKTLALLLLLVLSVTVLAACNQTQPTDKKNRWEANESLTYSISLANFDKKISTSDAVYPEEFLYAGETAPDDENVDRIVPTKLTGEYTISIVVDGATNNATITTNQTMDSTYDLALFTEEFLNSLPQTMILSQTDVEITLRSQTTTKVVFQNVPAQTPISSYTKVDGYYVGKAHKALSQYEISTTYEKAKKGMIAKTTQNGETTETEIDSTAIIDNNQVLYFVRSFDKKDTSFQDNPTVTVFDPLTKQSKTLSFYYTNKQSACVTHTYDDGTNADVNTDKLNRLDVLLGGQHYLTQVNLPDLTEKNLDYIPSDVPGVYFPKHTIVRFRVGYVTYHLQGLTDEIVNAIAVTPAT